MLGIKKAFYGLAFLALLLVLFQHGNAYNGTTTTTTGGGFASTRGVNFLLNGRPFFTNGFNAYWLMYIASDPAGRSRVTSAFQQASRFGMKVARTWAFSDGGNKPLQLSPGTYDEVMFKGLDFVVSEARKYGVYLTLSLVNNWNDYGGRKQYVQWARDRGQSLSSDDDFYRNDLVKGFYKNHVQAVLTRVNTITGVPYKDDPTIFAWELINEPQCQSDLSGRTLQDWITEMAAHVKSIDSNHLLEVGMEGFYGESVPERKQFNPGSYVVGTDFISNNQVPGIDFATIHAYPDQWKQGSNEQEQLGFLRSWVQSHVEDSGAVLGRPLLVTEFGKSSGLPGYTVALRDAFYGAVYDAVYASAQSGGPCAGGLFWQLLEEGMGNFGDGYEIVLSGDQQCPPSTANIISGQSRRISTLTRGSSIPSSSNINNMTNSTEKKKKKKATEEESVEGGKLP